MPAAARPFVVCVHDAAPPFRRELGEIVARLAELVGRTLSLAVEVSVNGQRARPGLALVAPWAIAAEQLLALIALCGRTVTWGRHAFVLDARGRILRSSRA